MTNNGPHVERVAHGKCKKVIVSGSRSITDPQVVREAVHDSPHTPYHGELVTGGARGVDTIAKKEFAGYQHVEYTEFEPDWDGNGKAAGPIRNAKMAEYADGLIAIWDGESSGTRDMIDKALDAGLEVYVHHV